MISVRKNSDITDYKFVIAVNKSIPIGVAMNGVGHISLGLMKGAQEWQKDKMNFQDFVDGDGNSHPYISALSLIICRASSQELKKIRIAALERGILYTDYLSTMTGGTYIEQLEKTRSVCEKDLEYYGIALFGHKDEVNPLTKRLSLYTGL